MQLVRFLRRRPRIISSQPRTGRPIQRAAFHAVESLEHRMMLALVVATSGNDLARFDTGATGVVTSVPVTGLQGG